MIHIGKLKNRNLKVAIISAKNGNILHESKQFRHRSTVKKNIIAFMRSFEVDNVIVQDDTGKDPVMLNYYRNGAQPTTSPRKPGKRYIPGKK